MSSLYSIVAVGVGAGLVGAVVIAIVSLLFVALFKRLLGDVAGKIVLVLAYLHALTPLPLVLFPALSEDFQKAMIIAPQVLLFMVALIVGCLGTVILLWLFVKRNFLGLATRRDRVVHSSQ